MMVKNHNHLQVVLVVAAGTLVAGGLLLLMLLVVVEPAGAAFPGQNGRIAFSSARDGFASTDACPEFPTSSPCHHEIYTMNSNGTDSVRLTNNTARDSDPAWSPNAPIPGANQIAFSSDRDGNSEIYTMNPSSAEEGPNGSLFVPTDRLTNDTAWDYQPAWSPDGNKIAFTSNRDAQHSPTGECVDPTFCNWNIYSMTQDGTGLEQVTTNTGKDYQPAWSPDGNKIAFVSNRGGASAIYTMNSDGSDVDQLTSNRDSEPDWSPDGNKIAFTRESGAGIFSHQKQIYTINADGTGSESLLTGTIPGEGWNFQPAWSPDGNKIAFTSNREGGSDIYTMNADGQGVDNPLTNSVTTDHEPDWQPFRETPVFPPRQLHHTATATSSATATATASAAGAAQYQYASALPGTGGVVSPVTLLAIIPAMLLVGGGLLSARLIRRS